MPWACKPRWVFSLRARLYLPLTPVSLSHLSVFRTAALWSCVSRGFITTCSCLYVRSYINSRSVTDF